MVLLALIADRMRWIVVQVVALNAAWIVVRSLSIHSKVMYCVGRGVRNDACVMLAG